MKEKKDQFEQFIADSFEKLAKEEEEKIEKESSIQMPEHAKESIRASLDDEIKKLEEKKAYEHLSEEDRRALELGRRMLREEREKPKDAEEQLREEPKDGADGAATGRKKWTGRKRLKVCLVLAAVLVLVMAISVTGLGGPERVIQMLTQQVGDREVEQVDSSDENLVIVEEDEEEAYQTLRRVFNVDLVRITNVPEDMAFDELYYDNTMQMAVISYKGNGQNIVLYVNALYTEASIGIDMDDAVLEKYTIENGWCEILVSEYRMENMKEKYSAKFTYNGLEYFLFSQTSKEEFDKILKGLYFFE